MHLKSLFRTTCIVWVSVFLIPFICHGSDALTQKGYQSDFPSLMESIQFKPDIEFCGIKIPIDDQEVKERLEKEMLLILWDRPQVILWIKRAARFFPHVEKILKEHGLPDDLKYVPIIESALRPHAGSSKEAIGFWQFIGPTGRNYGLRIDSQMDERRNIFKSTHAACEYLKAMKAQFGSYLLALSAYNMGEYGLEREITIQENTDFFSLYLPLETQRYAFRLFCAKLIFENPESYGFYLKNSDLYPVFSYDTAHIQLDFQIPISVIAKAAQVPFKTIKDYNPELRGYYLGKGDYTILMPEGSGKKFKQAYHSQYKEWEKTYSTKFHIVKNGDSLGKIAEKYNIPFLLLLKLNNLSVKSVIHPGDRLLIE